MKQYEEQNEYVVLDDRENVDNEEKGIPLNTFVTVKKFFINPVRAMKDIALRPKLLIPLLIITVSLLFTEMIFINLSDTQENLMQIDEPLLRNITLGLLMSMTIFLHLFLWLGKSIFTHCVAGILGGEGSFKGVGSVIAFSYLINILGEWIRAIISLISGTVISSTSIIILFTGIESETVVHTLLHQLNIFTIAYLVLATIGIMYVHNVSKLKAIIAVFGTWVAYIGFIVLFSSI